MDVGWIQMKRETKKQQKPCNNSVERGNALVPLKRVWEDTRSRKSKRRQPKGRPHPQERSQNRWARQALAEIKPSKRRENARRCIEKFSPRNRTEIFTFP